MQEPRQSYFDSVDKVRGMVRPQTPKPERREPPQQQLPVEADYEHILDRMRVAHNAGH